MMTQQEIENLCTWIKEKKGITEIDMMDLMKYIPEYREWLAAQN